jgi:hypothetical protein
VQKRPHHAEVSGRNRGSGLVCECVCVWCGQGDLQINWCWRGEWPTEEAAAAQTTSKCLANIAAAHAHLQVDHSLARSLTAQQRQGSHTIFSAEAPPREKSVGGWAPFYFVTRTHAGFIKRRTSRCFSPALSKRRLLIPPGCWRNRRHKKREESPMAQPASASTFVMPR